MPTVLIFASAREAAGRARAVIPGGTVAEVLAEARFRFGPRFACVLDHSRVWINGDMVGDDLDVSCRTDDEIAVLPPISGG